MLCQIFNIPEGPKQVKIYCDNITPPGTTLDEVWVDTVKATACLAHWGFMIHLAKSTFLVTKATLLGFDAQEGGCHLGQKALSKLFGATIPISLKELQGLLGGLNYVSALIP